jgi:hypothetical protein
MSPLEAMLVLLTTAEEVIGPRWGWTVNCGKQGHAYHLRLLLVPDRRLEAEARVHVT